MADQPCSWCKGSGLHGDGPGLTDDERVMLDSTRCYRCLGTGEQAEADRWAAAGVTFDG